MRSLPGMDLAKLMPSPEQLAKARDDLKALTPKQRESRGASLRAYCKKNPLSKSVGRMDTEERVGLLEKFQVMLNDFKDSQSTQTTDREVINRHAIKHRLIWESEEMLLKSVGDIKGTGWIESKLLPERPDKVTKRKDRYYVEYGRVEDIETWTDEDLRALKHRVEAELAAEDILQMNQLMMSNSREPGIPASSCKGDENGGAVTPTVVTKSPEELASEQMAKAITTLKADVSFHIKKYQDQALRGTLIRTKAEAVAKATQKPKEKKRANDLIEDLKSQEKKLKRAHKLFTRMLSEEAADEEMPALIKFMWDLDIEIADNMEWAAKIECNVETTSGPSAKKRKTRQPKED